MSDYWPIENNYLVRNTGNCQRAFRNTNMTHLTYPHALGSCAVGGRGSVHKHIRIDLMFMDPCIIIQCDSFGTRPKKMRISQRPFIRFWTCIYDYIPCFM